MLRRIQSFPLASTLRLTCVNDVAAAAADKALEDALASLPDGCWPAVTRIERTRGSAFALPPRAVAHLARLSPCLQAARISTWYSGEPPSGTELCGAMEGLGAAHSILEELVLDLSCSCSGPGIGRAAVALGRLCALRKLELY